MNERFVSLQIIGTKRKEKRFIKKVGIKSEGENSVGRVDKLIDFIKLRW